MRVTAAFSILAFATSAFAYNIIVPSPSQGWTTDGAQTVSWQRVDSDPSNFTIVLTNTNREVMPQNDLVLDALVVGTLLTTKVNPPSAGWPSGGTFRVNLVKDSQDLDTILAQSDEFNITAATTTSSSSGSTTGSTTSSSSISTTTVSKVVATTSAATDSNSESTGTAASSASPSTTSNAAASGIDTHSGLIGIVALLGLFFA